MLTASYVYTVNCILDDSERFLPSVWAPNEIALCGTIIPGGGLETGDQPPKGFRHCRDARTAFILH